MARAVTDSETTYWDNGYTPARNVREGYGNWSPKGDIMGRHLRQR